MNGISENFTRNQIWLIIAGKTPCSDIGPHTGRYYINHEGHKVRILLNSTHTSCCISNSPTTHLHVYGNVRVNPLCAELCNPH